MRLAQRTSSRSISPATRPEATGARSLDKEACFSVRLRVQEAGAQTPQTPVGCTAQIDYRYEKDKGWFYGFSGLIVDPVNTTNYAGTKVFIKWEVFPEYTEVWDSRISGLNWKTDTWPVPTDNTDLYVRLYFCAYNQRGELVPFESAPYVRLFRQAQATPLPPAPQTSTAQVWYKYINGQGWVFGFEGNVVPPADTSDFGGVEIYLHWIEGWNPDGSPIYDARYLGIQGTGPAGGAWRANEPGGFPLDTPGYSQQVDVIFVPKNARGIEVAGKESCFKIRLTVSSAFIDVAPDVALFGAGTVQPDGTFVAEPRWDTLNEQMVIDWGCFLPPDLSKFRGVSVFIRLPSGEYVKAPRGADGEDTEPQAGAAFLDSFAIDGDSVPTTPEDWVLIACSMNRFGQYNVDGSGNPTGPTITLRTIAPNSGVSGENLNPDSVGNGIIIDGSMIEFGTTTPDNMIMNPDFEYGFTKWGHVWAEIVAVGAYTGAKCAKFTHDSAFATQKYFHVRPLDRLTIDAWVMADPGTNGTLNLILRGWNATLSAYVDHVWKSQTPIGAWTKVSASVVIPADSPYTRIEVYAPWVAGLTAGAWYVDNVCLRREVSVGNGLAYDATGNLKIPDTGISRAMLENYIIDTAKLANVQIIQNAHIVRAGVNRLIVLDADIDSLRASAITAGTLSALVIYGGTIKCNQINTGTLYSVNLSGGTLDLNANGIRTVINNAYSAAAADFVGMTVYNSGDGSNPILIRPGIVQCYSNISGGTPNWTFEPTQWILFRPGGSNYGVQVLRDVSFMAIKLYHTDGATNVMLTTAFGGRIYVGTDLYVAGAKVLGARKTGWTLPTGTPRRTGFNIATATITEVAETLYALLQDLHATAGHGAIGA